VQSKIRKKKRQIITNINHILKFLIIIAAATTEKKKKSEQVVYKTSCFVFLSRSDDDVIAERIRDWLVFCLRRRDFYINETSERRKK
jgi:hypothetical protein